MTVFAGRYPYETPVTAYGNGGFRFAEMSHKGSILCLPTGIYAWEPKTAAEIGLAHLEQVLKDLMPRSVLLLGTGPSQMFPSVEIISAFVSAGIGLEPMTTGAAARTYNVLLAERRAVAAALIAVD